MATAAGVFHSLALVGRPDDGKFTLEQAKGLVIAKWKINWEETKKTNKDNHDFTNLINDVDNSRMLAAVTVEFTTPAALTRDMGEVE